MTDADARLIDGILTREGEAFTDDPADRGGATRWGVTIPVLAEFRGDRVTAAQIAALTRDEAAEVYEHVYLVRSGFVHLTDDRVRACLVDWGVLAGVGTATMGLQRLLGVTVDGICGPQTLAVANAYHPIMLLKRLGLARQRAHVRDVVAHPEQVRFLEGWLNRNWSVSVDVL